MKNLYFIAAFLCVAPTFSQQILWARYIEELFPRQYDCRLAAGHDGQFYCYGVGYKPGSKSPHGFVSAINVSGQKLFTLVFTGTVVPTSMVAGGPGRMYIGGYFQGGVKIGEQHFNSKGPVDGFVAAMDDTGNFDWISIVDGPDEEMVHGVAFNPVKGVLFATGGVTDAFYYNGALQKQVGEKPMLCAEIDEQGQLIRYRLYDFLFNDTLGNFGMEVQADAAGNYYLLHHREGKLWFEPSLPGNERGIYLSKLDDNLDPAWSNFIINGSCYYGYLCRRMTTTAGGNCFVPTYCEGKYGGSGLIRGYTPLGNCTFTVSNKDGSYSDLCSDGMNTFAIGTESANGCPCPSNTPGFRVVRKFEASGKQTALAVLGPKVWLTSILALPGGMVIVAGQDYSREYGDSTLQLGEFTLQQERVGATFLFAIGESQHLSTPEEKSGDLFSIFPNPSSGEVFIQLPQGASDLAVTDLLGRELYRHAAEPMDTAETLRLHGLPQGACFVTVSSGVRRQVKKLVVR